MKHKLIALVSVLVALASLMLWAVEKHDIPTHGTSHVGMNNHGGHLQQGGQATFAALIEIVSLLEGDAETNWSKVNIDGLREHLVDMNRLMIDTQSVTSLIGSTQIQYSIRGTKASIPSVHRMVPAHSRFIAESRGWTIEPELNDDGAVITITVEENELLNRLDALGFYGFMSLDSHHQAHHYQMANGISH